MSSFARNSYETRRLTDPDDPLFSGIRKLSLLNLLWEIPRETILRAGEPEVFFYARVKKLDGREGAVSFGLGEAVRVSSESEPEKWYLYADVAATTPMERRKGHFNEIKAEFERACAQIPGYSGAFGIVEPARPLVELAGREMPNPFPGMSFSEKFRRLRIEIYSKMGAKVPLIDGEPVNFWYSLAEVFQWARPAESVMQNYAVLFANTTGSLKPISAEELRKLLEKAYFNFKWAREGSPAHKKNFSKLASLDPAEILEFGDPLAFL